MTNIPLEHGNPIPTSERYTVVALDGETFIGCASGLAYKNGDDYNGWFYLSDLLKKAIHGSPKSLGEPLFPIFLKSPLFENQAVPFVAGQDFYPAAP